MGFRGLAAPGFLADVTGGQETTKKPKKQITLEESLKAEAYTINPALISQEEPGIEAPKEAPKPESPTEESINKAMQQEEDRRNKSRGRNSTILTSPFGVTGGSPFLSKATLLGS